MSVAWIISGWKMDALIVEHVLKAGTVDRVYQRCPTGFVDALDVL